MRKTRMISLAIVAAFLTLTVSGWGQEREAAQPVPAPPLPACEQVHKIFQLKYIEPSRLNDLLSQMIPGPPPSVDDRLKVLVLESCSSAQVEAVGEIVKTLDVPSPPAKNVELTAYILAERPQQIPASDLPPELDEVIAQLKKTFNFKFFQMLSTAALRIQDGESGSIDGAAGTNATFNLRIQRLSVNSGESASTVHLSKLDFLLFPALESSHDSKEIPEERKSLLINGEAGIHSTIDILAGQKVVVGKTSAQFPNRAVFLILTAKVVD